MRERSKRKEEEDEEEEEEEDGEEGGKAKESVGRRAPKKQSVEDAQVGVGTPTPVPRSPNIHEGVGARASGHPRPDSSSKKRGGKTGSATSSPAGILEIISEQRKLRAAEAASIAATAHAAPALGSGSPFFEPFCLRLNELAAANKITSQEKCK